METYLLDWANLLLRWLHVIAGVAWIGASFYFIMLDNSLRSPTPRDRQRGVSGELWAVHGGGIYQSRKYLLGPLNEPLSEHLHWSKWEAYTTWLSGMGLFSLIYWVGATTYLIDPQVMALSTAQAIAISVGLLIGSWLIYDLLCKQLQGRERLLAGILMLGVVAVCWGTFQLFSARAAYIQVGTILGTIMAANVFFQIIPGQKRMVAQIRAGEQPDPAPGIIGKQRSVHNTYFTLPVLFVMISHHYPMTYGHPQAWWVLLVILCAGACIRQFFVLRHRGQILWFLPLLGVALLACLIWYLRPLASLVNGASVSAAEVQAIINSRCLACHSTTPEQPGFVFPPLGLVFESSAQIQQHASRIAQSVQTGYMPLGNLTAMTDVERGQIAQWYAEESAASQQ